MRRSALPVALVCSGFSALAVEVLWERLLTPILGASTLAITAVLIAYMGGLALGAGIAGRVGDRLPPAKALLAYRLLEFLVWAAATITTLVLTALPVGVAGVLSALPEGPIRFFGRFLIAAALLLLPTTAMGATLPFAVRAAAGSAVEGLLGKTALLYTANTAGAVMGALAGPLLLLPRFGVKRAALIAATGSVLAVLAATFAKLASAEDDRHTDKEAASDAGRTAGRAVLLATFAFGATSLGLEVVWTRALGTVAGSTVYAFGVVLALVLSGIALGSAGVSLLGRCFHAHKRSVIMLALLAWLAPLLAVFLIPLFDHIAVRFADLTSAGAMTFRSSMGVVMSVGAWVILPPTLCFGAALPLAVRAVRASNSNSARSVGRVYVANTVGALLGAATTGLLLMPTIGEAHTASTLAILPAVAGLLLWLGALPGSVTWKRMVAGVLGLVCLAGLLAFAPRPSALAAAAGIHSNRKNTRVNVVYYGEGPEASVLVESAGAERTFYVAGRPEASNLWYDVRTQYLLGHLPALVAGGAKSSLVIGLGSGMTAGALTLHGDVTICELNRAVPGAAAEFRDYNHDVLHHARLVIEDGRVALTRRGARFDVVTTDPIHPYVAGSASLYTTEHLRLSREHLAPNGAVSLWIPLHRMGLAELRAIVGSFVDAFPNAELYLIHNDVVMLGGGRGGKRSRADRTAMFRQGWTEAVAGDMRKARLYSPEEVANLMVAGPDALARFAAGARRNRDDDPWIEFSLPLFVHKDTRAQNLEALLALRDPSEAKLPESIALESSQWSYLSSSPGRALENLKFGVVDGSSPTREHQMAIRESNASLAMSLWRGGNGCKALALARREAAHPDATVESLLRVEELLHNENDWPWVDRATARLKSEWPDRCEGYLWAGDALVRQARFEEAVPDLERAAALDYFRSYAVSLARALGRAYMMSGRAEKGRAVIRDLLARDPAQTDMQALLAATPAQLADMRKDAEDDAKKRALHLDFADHPL
jgi:spermidine synthase